jgi:pseudaminic acid biosynthesis-associated methylase
MGNFKTEQEIFWAGDFGTEYISRNESQYYLAANLSFFGKILAKTNNIKSVMEFGPNIGMNLKAIDLLLPNVNFAGIEINADAFNILQDKFPKGNFINQSIAEFDVTEVYDLCLVKGVLIHLNPNLLELTYEKMYKASRKYILISEYYNPSPVTVEYRGHSDRLYKRDFAGEFLKKYPDMKLVDYGFSYHLDPNFPQDDETWFLMEKMEG